MHLSFVFPAPGYPGTSGHTRSSELDKFPANIRRFPRRAGHLQHRVTDKVPAPIPRGELVKSQSIFRSNPGRHPPQQPILKAFQAPTFPSPVVTSLAWLARISYFGHWLLATKTYIYEFAACDSLNILYDAVIYRFHWTVWVTYEYISSFLDAYSTRLFYTIQSKSCTWCNTLVLTWS